MTAGPSIAREPIRLLPLFGWFTGAMFFFYAWVLRVAPSVMVEELMAEFAVGAAVLGNLSAAYFYGYSGMQIPVGILLDRFGPRRLMTAAAALCGCGCLLFGLGGSLTEVILGRFLIGASAAFSLVGAMAVAGSWFGPHRFAVLSGLAMALGMAGGMFGQAPLRLVVEAADWRAAMLMLAAGGFAISIAAWASVRDRGHGPGGPARVMEGLATVMRSRQTWLIAFAGLGSTAPLLAFAGLWGVPFLVVAYGLDAAGAATLTSLMFAGWGIGAPLIGLLSDRLGRRCMPLLAGIALETASLAALVLLPDLPVWALGLLSFLTGFFGSAQICCFALVRESHPSHLSGTAIGLVNAMVTGAGALFQPLIGFLLDLAWNGAMSGGARLYDAGAYRFAFGALIGVCVLATLSVFVIRETWCRPK